MQITHFVSHRTSDGDGHFGSFTQPQSKCSEGEKSMSLLIKVTCMWTADLCCDLNYSTSGHGQRSIICDDENVFNSKLVIIKMY